MPWRVWLLLAALTAEALLGSEAGAGVHPTVTAGCGLPEGQALASSERLSPRQPQVPTTFSILLSISLPLREVKPVSVGAPQTALPTPARTLVIECPGSEDSWQWFSQIALLPGVESRRSFPSAPRCPRYEEGSRFPCAVPAS